MRRTIPTIWEKRQGSLGFGPPLTFWPFIVSLKTVMALVDVSFSFLNHDEHLLRPKFWWKMTVLPSWTYLILNSLCHVLRLCHSFKSCTLPPSCLTWAILLNATIIILIMRSLICLEITMYQTCLEGLPYEWVSEVPQSCPTLCDPVDCNLPGSSVHGILQARILEWASIQLHSNHIK